MSEPSAQAPDEGTEWRPLADQIAVNVKNFIDGVEALAQSGGDETVPLLLLEVSQILLAGAQLGASSDVILPGNWEPEVGDDPDLDVLRTGLAWPVRGRRVRRGIRPVQGHLVPAVPDLGRHRGRGRRPPPRPQALPGRPVARGAVVVAVLLFQPLGYPRRGRTARAARRGRARQPGRRRGEHQPVTTAGQPGPFG